MRLLCFLFGAGLFIVAGFTQNALLGLLSVVIDSIAMLWPSEPQYQAEKIVESERSHAMPHRFEPALSNVKDSGYAGNILQFQSARPGQRDGLAPND